MDFTDLNTICPKESYPLSNFDNLIDRSSIYRTLSFMDAYSGYNHIRMDPLGATKTLFMLNHDNYYYNVIPFSLKNVSSTYQRLMDIVFSHNIGQNLEVYVNNMIVKATEGCNHDANLEDVTP